eukprot:TRINITY_DN3003_c0_g1_i1.p1 TRINITY_DN3003_c0_g1~~TRINITY_DN3003_c0_g1_i1.p1  ORF type:complete len:321 (+),score=52.53 TRINITY_DN3003_c0_g1_i1:30-992(+)
MKEEIYWAQLDLQRMLFYSSGFLLGVRALVFPPMLIKTRLQAQEDHKYKGTLHAFKLILREEGIRGLYKGFMTMAIGILPVQMIYVTTYEWVRAHTPIPNAMKDQPEPFQNFVGGGVASLASTSINVPIEVISQRLMLQGTQSNQRYTGGLNALQTIVQQNGVRGLYRGYYASLATFVPGSAIWWGTYGLIKNHLVSAVQSVDSISWLAEPPYDLSLAALSGLLAGTVSATTTNPLDIAKTRIQTTDRKGESSGSMYSIIRNLVKEEGVRALGRGVTARILANAPMSILMITSYEQVKRLSITTPETLPTPPLAPPSSSS